MLTISGTPRWANGGKSPNVMPSARRRLHRVRARDRVALLRALRRLSVRPLLVGLERAEPALGSSTPQFDRRGKSVAPANYAKLYAAAYDGHQGGQPARAGRASARRRPRGSDKPQGLRPDHSPGTLRGARREGQPAAQVRRVVAPPVPVQPEPRRRARSSSGRTSRWPRFPASTRELKRWFKRKSVPIWITEYGHQTSPPDSFGVSYATQAAYIRAGDRDGEEATRSSGCSSGSSTRTTRARTWESGLYTQDGAAEGRRRRARSRPARSRSTRGTRVYTFRAGTLDAAREPVHAALLRR